MGLDKHAAKMRNTFTLRTTTLLPLNRPPTIRWDGDYQQLGYRRTEVNVRKLGDLAGHIVAAVQRAPYPDGLRANPGLQDVVRVQDRPR